MAKAVGIPQNSYCLVAKVRAPLLDSTSRYRLHAPRPDSVFLAHPSNMNNRGGRHELVWRAVVTDDFTYAVTESGEHRLWANTDGYQVTNLLGNPAHSVTGKRLWERLDRWMEDAERPFYDNWFARAPEKKVAAWNAEHGLNETGADRQAGRAAVFDMSASRPW